MIYPMTDMEREAAARHIFNTMDGSPIARRLATFKYFCGICWAIIKKK